MKRKKTALLASFLAACSLLLSVGCDKTPSNLPENGESIETPDTGDSSTPETTPDSTPESTPPPESEPPKPTVKQYIRCTGSSVNLRSGAGTDFTVLGQAEQGTMYAITGKTGSWYQTYYRGKTAYIYAEYATVFTLPLSQNEKTEAVIEEAYKHIGVPYVYGAIRLHDGKGNFLKGFTTQKFDCSSLVQYVYYKAAGKLLNVTTRTSPKGSMSLKRTCNGGTVFTSLTKADNTFLASNGWDTSPSTLATTTFSTPQATTLVSKR